MKLKAWQQRFGDGIQGSQAEVKRESSRFDQLRQATTLGAERVPDDGLQRGVSWPHDALTNYIQHV